MKASLFFIVLGITLCTSLWAAARLAWPYALRAANCDWSWSRMTLAFYTVASFWIVAAGPITLLVIILNKPHK